MQKLAEQPSTLKTAKFPVEKCAQSGRVITGYKSAKRAATETLINPRRRSSSTVPSGAIKFVGKRTKRSLAICLRHPLRSVFGETGVAKCLNLIGPGNSGVEQWQTPATFESRHPVKFIIASIRN